MSIFQEHRVKLVLAALLLGVIGDWLLRVFPWGLNASIWLALVILAHAVYGRGMNARMAPGIRRAMGAALLFGILISWRDAPALKALNVSVVLVSIIIATAFAVRKHLRHVWLGTYLVYAAEAVAGMLSLLRGVAVRVAESTREHETKRSIPLRRVLRGLFISVPLVIAFGGLFFSADANFEGLVIEVFEIDISEFVEHVAISGLCAWFAAAVVTLPIQGTPARDHQPRSFVPLASGAIEVNVVLGVINLLFATFVAIQLQYLVGSHDRVFSEDGLTYAEYARRGFFELSAVAALALLLLLTCAFIVDNAGRWGKRAFVALGCTLIVLVLVILASSLHRMSIYIEVYGLTRLRLYTGCFSLWIGTVYLWLAFTFIRDRAWDFAFGFLLSGYAAAILLQLVNPDAIITRVNVARMQEGKSFDAAYALSLGADAVPEFAAALPSMSPERRREISSALEDQWLDEDFSGPRIRTWSWSRHRAVQAVKQIASMTAE